MTWLKLTVIRDKREDFTLCIVTNSVSRIIFKLVWARCPPVAGLKSGFVFHYARPFITLGHSLRSAVILWCRKPQTDLRGMLNSRYIYNIQITTKKVLCADLYTLVAKLWKTNGWAQRTRSFPKVLQLVNKNPYVENLSRNLSIWTISYILYVIARMRVA